MVLWYNSELNQRKKLHSIPTIICKFIFTLLFYICFLNFELGSLSLSPRYFWKTRIGIHISNIKRSLIQTKRIFSIPKYDPISYSKFNTMCETETIPFFPLRKKNQRGLEEVFDRDTKRKTKWNILEYILLSFLNRMYREFLVQYFFPTTQ